MLSRSLLVNALAFARRLFVGWIAIYVVVCLAAGGLEVAKPLFRVCGVLWLVILIMLSRYGANGKALAPLSRFGRLFEIVITNIAFTLFLAECALQLHARASGQSLIISRTLNAHKLVPHRDYGYGLCGNSLGYPGPDIALEKANGSKRIAVIGDSFAVGPAVPYEANFITLLDQRLKDAEVMNFGVSGAGPREYLTILQQDVLRFRPDMVIVCVFIGNDITERLPTPRHMAPEGHSLYLLGQSGWRMVRERHRRPAKNWTVRRLESPLSAPTFREVEARRLQVCVTPVSSRMEKKWQRAFDDLERIISVCKGRKIPVGFVLIPDEFQVNPGVLRDAMRQANVNGRSIDLDLPQRRMKRFFQEKHVDCLDLLPAFQKHKDTYASNDTHWNGTGNQLAASSICKWLKDCHELRELRLSVGTKVPTYIGVSNDVGRDQCPGRPLALRNRSGQRSRPTLGSLMT